MIKNTAVHSLVLLLAMILAFFFVSNPHLSDYSLQLTAVLVIFLILSHKIFQNPFFLLTESTVSTICVLLITSSTGGLTSPFFFLNHFLLFELSLLLEPSISLVLTLGLMSFYLYTNQVGSSIHNFTVLLSFVFMTPLAYLVGRIYQRVKRQKIQIYFLSNKINKMQESMSP